MCKLSHSWECGVCILPSYEMLSIQTFRAPVIISGAAPRVGERGTRSPLHRLRRTALRSYSMRRGRLRPPPPSALDRAAYPQACLLAVPEAGSLRPGSHEHRLSASSRICPWKTGLSLFLRPQPRGARTSPL